MRYPKRLPAGKVFQNQVSPIDIMPTIFDLLGLGEPVPMDGCSLVPLIEGRTDHFREEAYAGVPPAGWQRLVSDERLIWSVRNLEWKLVLHVDPVKGTREYELYNLREDPGERRNLFDSDRDQADALKAKLDAHMASRAGA